MKINKITLFNIVLFFTSTFMVPQAEVKDATLLLELKVVCTNDPRAEILDESEITPLTEGLMQLVTGQAAPGTPAAPAIQTPATSTPVQQPAATLQATQPRPAQPTAPQAAPSAPGQNAATPQTQQPAQALSTLKISEEDYIKGGKVYSEPFDLPRHKKCYFIAKKYKDDAPQAEIKEAVDNIYFGTKGPEDIF